jgi:DNA primase
MVLHMKPGKQQIPVVLILLSLRIYRQFMNIIELLQSDGIQPEHASRGEWHSPCPECGGRDRFSCWPEKVNSNGHFMGGRFCCRGCGFNGDAVSYLRKHRGLTFLDAVKVLGIDPGQMPERIASRAWQPEPPKAAPGAVWQARAGAFTSACQELERNSEAVAWLQAERGLNLETISRAGLGWNPQDKRESRESWGLPEEISQQTGNVKKVWLPSGLVIPLTDDAGRVIRLRIRRNDPGTGSRYVVVSGSSMQAMIQWQNQKAVAIVESELDGLLVQQEAVAVVGVIALGSAAMKTDSDLHGRLMKVQRILCCLDSDQAGGKAARGFWTRYPGFKRWPPLSGKDPGEMFKVGVPIRAWVEAGL